MKSQMPAEQHHKVAHANLKSGAKEFSATDWLDPKRTPRQGNTIFDKLAAGAKKELLDDLRDMPFGSYGHLADKYGVHWFFQGDKAAQ